MWCALLHTGHLHSIDWRWTVKKMSHSKDELHKFGSYLCLKVEKLGDENFKILQAGGAYIERKNVIFADTLTLIFEGIARIIELHQPVIDDFEDSDKLLFLLEMTQVECNKQALRVIDAFNQKRQIEFRSNLIQKYLCDSLVNSDEKVDAMELDVILSEFALIFARTELYWQFLRRKLNKDANIDLTCEREKSHRSKRLHFLFHQTALSIRIQDLMDKYVLMEQYYLRESMIKAVHTDKIMEEELTSTALDDISFIVRKIMQRSVSTSSVDCTCAIFNCVLASLEIDFLSYAKSLLQACYSNVSEWKEKAYQFIQDAFSAINGGHIKAASSESHEAAFSVILNNLSEAAEWMGRLKSEIREKCGRQFKQISESENAKLQSSIDQTDSLIKLMENCCDDGVVRLFEHSFYPEIKRSAQRYYNLTLGIDEDDFQEYGEVYAFINNFIFGLDKEIARFERLLVPKNYQMLLNRLSKDVVNAYADFIDESKDVTSCRTIILHKLRSYFVVLIGKN